MQQWDNDKLSMFLLDKWIKQDFRPGHCGLILICIFFAVFKCCLVKVKILIFHSLCSCM